jgi:CheY-like chemotaxis protein
MAMKSMPSRALSGLHTLLVDGDRDGRELHRLLLAYYGASVSVATSAPAALTALSLMTPDVVLADAMLGGGHDGLWLRRQAARQWPHVPFIAMSADEVDSGLLDRAGFVTCLRKPVPHDRLVNAVLSAVAQPSGASLT